MEGSLKNKTALVTGAGKGIGHAICRQLANEGARIIAVARNKENLQLLKSELQNEMHHFWSIDLSEELGQQQLVKNLETEGMPHIVVNNLNIVTVKKRLINTTAEMFKENFSVNLDHLFAMAEKVLQYQRKEGFGRWIGISSLTARGGIPGQLKYAAQKSAMEAVFMNIAVEEGKYGITSNIVAPGFIETPGIKERLTQPVFEKFSGTNVLKRAGSPEEVAAAVRFLSSPEASYITGVILPVSGGAQLAWFYN